MKNYLKAKRPPGMSDARWEQMQRRSRALRRAKQTRKRVKGLEKRVTRLEKHQWVPGPQGPMGMTPGPDQIREVLKELGYE